jgi:valyl-tRNA synthetase
MMVPHLREKIEKQTRKEFPEGIAAYGTDALRYTYYSLASTGRDINFDVGRIEGFRNFCNKIWNAARYVLLNTEDHDCGQQGGDVELSLADRWIISRLQRSEKAVEQAIANYRFDLASQAIYDFIWNEYCDWYLELSKPVLWDDTSSNKLRQGTLRTLLEVLETILRLMHPLMPFITEEIWQNVAPRLGISGDTIMLAQWPEADHDLINGDAEAEMEWLKSIIVAVRTIRSESNIPPGDELALILGNTVTEDSARVTRHTQALAKLAKVASITIAKPGEEQPPTLSALAGTIEVMVPMAGVIDVDKELARLAKELDRLTAEQGRLTGKLSNDNFVARAPADVVDKERAKLADIETSISSVTAQKSKMEELR